MWEDKNLEELVEAIVSLQSGDEAQAFLRDLMTEAELNEFARRWKAARMLHSKIPYTTIEKETGLSSATIARVSKWLQEGSGGYRLMLQRFVDRVDPEPQSLHSAVVVSEQSDKNVHIG